MTDVFLSYSSSDRAIAERVQSALAARGLDVFWDQTIPAGQDWDTWIRAKLSAARVVVVLWSRTSVASPSVRHEAMVARDAGKLVPVMIDVLKPEDFPMGLYLVQAISVGDARDSKAPGMAKLLGEIETRLERAPTPTPQRPRSRGTRLPLILAGALLVTLAAGLAVWRFGFATTPDVASPSPGDEPSLAAADLPAAPDTTPPTSAAAAPSGADACVQARADWEAVRESNTVSVLEAFVAATPTSCAVLLSVAEGRIAALQSGERAAREKKSREWNGVPGFEGDWVMESGGCFELPWRFEPVDVRLRRTLSSGAADMWEIASVDPPKIRQSDGYALTLEGGSRIRYTGPEGAVNCVLKRR